MKTDLYTVLTDKEQAVCNLLLRDMTDKEISAKLDISRIAVSKRIESARQKVSARSRIGLAVTWARFMQKL